MIPKSRPVLYHTRFLMACVLLALLVLGSSIVSAAAVSGAGLTVKPTLIVARTTVTPTPVPTVTCTAPCECLSPSQATAKWGSAFTRCQAAPCGYIYQRPDRRYDKVLSEILKQHLYGDSYLPFRPDSMPEQLLCQYQHRQQQLRVMRDGMPCGQGMLERAVRLKNNPCRRSPAAR